MRAYCHFSQFLIAVSKRFFKVLWKKYIFRILSPINTYLVCKVRFKNKTRSFNWKKVFSLSFKLQLHSDNTIKALSTFSISDHTNFSAIWRLGQYRISPLIGDWQFVIHFRFVLFCFVLFCFVLFCFVLFCFVLLCFVLFCFVLFCFFVCLFVWLVGFVCLVFVLFCFCFVFYHWLTSTASDELSFTACLQVYFLRFLW